MSSEIFNRAQDVFIASCLGNAMNMISDWSLLITRLWEENNHTQRKRRSPLVSLEQRREQQKESARTQPLEHDGIYLRRQLV